MAPSGGAQRSTLGVAALGLGLLAVPAALLSLPGLVVGIPAVIVGMWGRRRARDESTSAGMATAGAVLGSCAVVIAILETIYIMTAASHLQ
jgi:hypothetical protein